MRILLLGLFLGLTLDASVLADQSGTTRGQEGSTWNLGALRMGEVYPTTITASNVSCRGRQTFVVSIEETPWLRLAGPATLEKIGIGESKTVPAIVDLSEVVPGDHRGSIVIRCTSCPPPPRCVQNVTRIDVVMTVVEPPPEATPEEPDTREPGTSSPVEGRAEGGAGKGEELVDDQAKACALKPATRRQVYSRGNNDAGELKQQYLLTKKRGVAETTTQFQTGELTFDLSTVNRCHCPAEGRGDCAGEIDLVLTVRVKNLTKYKNRPSTWAVHAVDAYSVPTRRARPHGKPEWKLLVTFENGAVALPELQEKVELQLSDMHAAEKVGNVFEKVRGKKPGERFFVARSVHRLSCSAGSYPRRFLFGPRTEGGRTVDVRGDFKPQLALDAMVVVTAPEDCVLAAQIPEMFAWEIIYDYPWHEGIDEDVLEQVKKDLPEVSWRIPATPPGAETSQRNLLKLVEDDGAEIEDQRFPDGPGR